MTDDAPSVPVPVSAYTDLQQAGSCAYSRHCKRPLAPDADLCGRHLKRERQRKAKVAAAARANNRALGLCAFCGAKSATYRCMVCTAKSGRVPTTGVASGVAAGSADAWRKDNDGWERYRGKGRRGPPPITKVADEDLAAAAAELAKARAALAYYASPEVQGQGRIAKQGVKDVAIAQLALAARFVDQIVDVLRGGGSKKAGA